MSTPAEPASSLALRTSLAGLTLLAFDDLGSGWLPAGDDPQAAQGALADLLAPLLATYGAAAAALAADWYDELRDTDKITGRFRAAPAVLGEQGAAELAGFAVGPLFGVPDRQAAITLAQGGLQRRIADAARQTVMGSALADPRADGWQRVTHPEACAFCRMIAGRGAVFRESTADFASHDHCFCTAIPSWTGKPRPVRPYTPSARGTTDADRARAREWIREHA